MAIISKSKSYSRRSIGAVLLVGVLAGVTVGGGVGVIAASTTKSVTVCVDKEDNHMNYSKDSKCRSHQYKVVLNQKGVAGAKGDAGTAGTTGTNGATGVAGAKGAAGTSGTNGTNGTDGAAGTNGTNGTDGAAGTNGTNGTNGASAPVATGTNCVATKCTYKIGDTGPGGGSIFFVDDNDQYTSLDYLEAAPMGWGNGITVNQGGLTGETTGSSTADPLMKWCSNTTSLLGLDAWSNSAVGTGASNTSTADAMCAGGAIQAASDYSGGSQTDWFLPSVGEAMLMYTNLRQVGVGGFASGGFWGSSEFVVSFEWGQFFYYGFQSLDGKAPTNFVRPVRAF